MRGLFFWYDAKAKVIVYVGVNNETTLRSSGSKSDPYVVFDKMPGRGNHFPVGCCPRPQELAERLRFMPEATNLYAP